MLWMLLGEAFVEAYGCSMAITSWILNMRVSSILYAVISMQHMLLILNFPTQLASPGLIIFLTIMRLTYNPLWKVILFYSNLLHHWAWQVESFLYCQSTQCMMLASMYCQGVISGCYEFCPLPYMFLLNMCVSGVQAAPQFCFCCFSLCSLRLGFLFLLFADLLSDVKSYNLIIWFLSILSRFT